MNLCIVLTINTNETSARFISRLRRMQSVCEEVLHLFSFLRGSYLIITHVKEKNHKLGLPKTNQRLIPASSWEDDVIVWYIYTCNFFRLIKTQRFKFLYIYLWSSLVITMMVHFLVQAPNLVFFQKITLATSKSKSLKIYRT